MKKAIFILHIFFTIQLNAQKLTTVFETTKGIETATYQQTIKFYEQVARIHKQVKLFSIGSTDAGLPLHVVVLGKPALTNLRNFKKDRSLVILVNNGIHPGEPDGIDASMMLVRDIAEGKVKLPDNTTLAIIPVYNIGGALNRGSTSRINQDGPASYGFRGNAQNLDLNRDFVKADAKETRSFYEIYHLLNPDIFLDNHVSDGADYQYTMTLLTSQHSKIGGPLGNYLHGSFEPALYAHMKKAGFEMTPYVNFDGVNPDKGWAAFFDPPRFASGYAAMFNSLSFVAETHMLKPFAKRVEATYQLMRSMIDLAAANANDIQKARRASNDSISRTPDVAINWKVDSSRYQTIDFLGYEEDSILSEVTGLKRLSYNRQKPFKKSVKFYNYYIPVKSVQKPKAYIVPQAWWAAIDLMKLNGVKMSRLTKDTVIDVDYYRVESFKSYPRPYEKHHRNYDVKLSNQKSAVKFRKGDYVIYMGQPNDRYIVEVLEPEADDSFFSWNFFDGVLQRKEYYSEYRWEDVAAAYLKKNPELQKRLEEKRKADAKFAASSAEQLNFVFVNSPYYEPEHLRYPVYRLQ